MNKKPKVEEIVTEFTIHPIATDFGRDDINAIAHKINEIINHLKNHE